MSSTKSESILSFDQTNQLAAGLTSARTSSDLAMIEAGLSSDLLGIHAIVALRESSVESRMPSVSFPIGLLTDHIVPYFSHQNLHFIHHEKLKRVTLAVDYSITFDTNAATHIRRIVENGSLKALGESVAKVFDIILMNDWNFDRASSRRSIATNTAAR